MTHPGWSPSLLTAPVPVPASAAVSHSMSPPTSPPVSLSVTLLVLTLALVAGVVLERWHRRGGHLHPEEIPLRRVPAGTIAAATVVATGLLLDALPHDTPAARVALGLHVVVAVAGVTACAVDVAVHRLPDTITLPLAAATLVGFLTLATVAACTSQETAALAAGRAVLAGLVAPAVFLLLTLTIGGIGLGDAKFACPLGAVLGWHGWGCVVEGFALAWVLAGLTAAWWLLRRRARPDSPLPLGPFLGVGALLAVLAAA